MVAEPGYDSAKTSMARQQHEKLMRQLHAAIAEVKEAATAGEKAGSAGGSTSEELGMPEPIKLKRV